MKRGSILDIPFLLIGIMSLAITFLVVNTIITALANSDTVIGDSTDFDTFKANTVDLMDYLIVFAFFGGFIASIILAAMTRSTPLMFAFSILFLVIMVFISPIIANVYEVVATNAGIESAGHSGIDLFFQNLPTIILVFGGAIMLALLWGGGSE